MNLRHPDADILIPDGSEPADALSRTTHLCVGAHQDDEEINAYHAIAECYRHPDRAFTGVCVTSGSGSSRTGPYATVSDDEMRFIRRDEQRQAAIVGRYTAQLQLMYPSAHVKDPAQATDVTADLRDILDATRPEVLYVHNPADKHDTHVACFLRTLDAVRQLPAAARPARVLGYEGWRSLDWVLDAEKVPLPVDAYPNLFAALVGIFDSQISGGKRYDLAIRGRTLGNATFYQSHAADGPSALSWALDLTPLFHDDTADPTDFTLAFIDRLRDDVQARLKKFQI